MFVNCPHCQSLVAVDATTGAAPEHCPYCDGAITVALADAEPNAPIASIDSEAAAPEVLHETALDIQAIADDENLAPDDQPASDAAARTPPGAQATEFASTTQKRRKNAHPSFAKRPVPGAMITHRARWPWPLAAGLMLLLLLQLIVADRVSLAAHPGWRVTITKVCNVLRCDIPPWREAGAFTMLTRDVHAHPAIADALRIRAAFRNDARWAQPWPQLVVTLSDAS
ncbi:MAG: DUF3426 domain-containing protein, partial [Pseudomonadota bacterium]|nr:DUF3426 domain-containing protein [Pseudomonadota bacterium]